MNPLRASLLIGVLWCACSARAVTLTVTNAADTGAGTLRQAITDANTNASADTIAFSIGSGVQTITLSTALPDIVFPVTIDGATQPGYAGAPLIELYGNLTRTFDGLTINASNCTVRALAVRGFGNTSSARRSGIVITNLGGNTIVGCYLGVVAAGNSASRNSQSGLRIINSAGNKIGGTNANEGNLISGNSLFGVELYGGAASNNTIVATLIGLDATGTNALANGAGLIVSNAPANTIGGTTTAARNTVAGNSLDQITITGAAATGNFVLGNYIGLRANGTALGSSPANGRGVLVDGAAGNTIGGTAAGAGNVISGNATGVLLNNAGTSNNLVAGNLIGLAPSGSVRIANTTGVSIGAGTAANTVGGTSAAAHNVISGNVSDGVRVQDSSGNTVQGNFIGTDATGMSSIGNGSGSGIVITVLNSNATANVIGGAAAGAGNVISGNTNNGVTLSGLGASNNVIAGNFIGVAADGAGALGNLRRGLAILGGGSNYVGTANVIANNGLDGVLLAGGGGLITSPPFATNNFIFGNTIYSNGVLAASLSSLAAGVTLLGPNEISSNSIYDNLQLGIDRAGDGPTANVANGAANFPVLTGAVQGSTIVDGTLNGRFDCDYVVEFFITPAAIVPAQGKIPIGKQSIHTDGSGNASFHFVSPYTAAVGDKITATATGYCFGAPETSEISVSATVTASAIIPYVGKTFANTVFAGTERDPISTFSGELFDALPPDLVLDGPMPLAFTRYYAAFIKVDGKISGALGDNWLHNFELKLSVTPTNTEVITARGRIVQFTNSGGNYFLAGRQDVAFQLATNGGNHFFGDPRSQRVFTFDGKGKLTAIADGHGNAHTLTYAGAQLASVSDGLGRVLTFLYNAGGQLTNVSDGSRAVAFTQSGNNLASARSPLGFVTAYAYDLANANAGLLTAATLPMTNVPFAQTFDASGRVATQTENGANVWALNYSGTTTTVTNPLGNTVQDVHGVNGNLTAFTDESGQTLALGSNAKNQRTLVTDRLGGNTRIGFHAPSGAPSALTNADGTVTAFSYAARTNSGVVFYDLSSVSYPDGAVETFSYDANGNLRTRADRAGQVFGFSYNARGQVLTATNPLGGVTTLTYNADGTAATRQDSDTGVTQFQYDPLKRLTNVIHPDAAKFSTAFDADDRVTSVTDERGNVTRFSYDANGRLTQTVDANSRTNQFAYDARNRVVRAVDRNGQTAARAFDALGHVAAVTNRNGNVTRFTYDARQRLTAVTDAGGQVWSFSFDNENLRVASANPLSQTNRMGRDALSYVTGVTNALAQSASFTRDALRRVTRTVDGIGRTNSFAYEARGLLTNSTKPLIGGAGYQRNALGELSRITGLNGEQWNFSYTPMGRLLTVVDPLNRAATNSYDARGRVAKTVFADGVTRSNTFDAANNPTRWKYSAGPDLQFTYDALNRLATADNLAFSYDAEGRVTNTASSGVNYGAAYDADGRLASVAYHGGAFTVNYAYDSRDRLTQVSDTLTGTTLTFGYDNAGRLTSITRPNGVNGAYTYDAAGRLTRIQEGGIVDLQYTVDAAGQIVAANFLAPLDLTNFLATANPVFSYDAAHQVANAGYAFDARGRQTFSPGHSFSWDGASRLTAIDSVALSYNGASDVLTRTTNGVVTRFYYNHAVALRPVMTERNETAGAVQRYYVWTPGGRLLYVINAAAGNSVSHVHADRVGTVLALTSAAGAVTDAYAWSPYGVLLGRTGTNAQPFTYVGAFGVRSESAANLFQMRARYYDPAAARFLSCDPVWPRLANPMELNPYQYVSQQPLAYVDPEGLFEIVIYYDDPIEDQIELNLHIARDKNRLAKIRLQATEEELAKLQKPGLPVTKEFAQSEAEENFGSYHRKEELEKQLTKDVADYFCAQDRQVENTSGNGGILPVAGAASSSDRSKFLFQGLTVFEGGIFDYELFAGDDSRARNIPAAVCWNPGSAPGFNGITSIMSEMSRPALGLMSAPTDGLFDVNGTTDTSGNLGLKTRGARFSTTSGPVTRY